MRHLDEWKILFQVVVWAFREGQSLSRRLYKIFSPRDHSNGGMLSLDCNINQNGDMDTNEKLTDILKTSRYKIVKRGGKPVDIRYMHKVMLVSWWDTLKR